MMTESDLIELGVRFEEAKISLQDACVYLRRLKRADDIAMVEMVLGNVQALKSRFQSWASEKYGLGLNDAVLEAMRKKAEA